MSSNKKTIKISPYECKLTIIFDENINEALGKYKIKTDFSDYGAVTFKIKNDYRHYGIVFTQYWRSLIAHEVVHLVNHIYLDCAMPLDRIDDEPQAYLTGWLFEQIDDFLIKVKPS